MQADTGATYRTCFPRCCGSGIPLGDGWGLQGCAFILTAHLIQNPLSKPKCAVSRAPRFLPINDVSLVCAPTTAQCQYTPLPLRIFMIRSTQLTCCLPGLLNLEVLAALLIQSILKKNAADTTHTAPSHRWVFRGLLFPDVK